MAELEVTKVAEQLNHRVLYKQRETERRSKPYGISDRHPRSGISERERSRRLRYQRCPHP
jgi:hypothetical protein